MYRHSEMYILVKSGEFHKGCDIEVGGHLIVQQVHSLLPVRIRSCDLAKHHLTYVLFQPLLNNLGAEYGRCPKNQESNKRPEATWTSVYRAAMVTPQIGSGQLLNLKEVERSGEAHTDDGGEGLDI